MRISDWSSDVCSSDLAAVRRHFGRRHPLDAPFRHVFPGGAYPDVLGSVHRTAPVCSTRIASIAINVALDRRRSRTANSKTSLMFSGCEFAPPHAASSTLARSAISAATSNVARLGRSEEHTSELQSIMRLSYADFCLNK